MSFCRLNVDALTRYYQSYNCRQPGIIGGNFTKRGQTMCVMSKRPRRTSSTSSSRIIMCNDTMIRFTMNVLAMLCAHTFVCCIHELRSLKFVLFVNFSSNKTKKNRTRQRVNPSKNLHLISFLKFFYVFVSYLPHITFNFFWVLNKTAFFAQNFNFSITNCVSFFP